MDPKAAWAVNHLDLFPVEVNTAPLEVLLRVPGIGPTWGPFDLASTTHNLFAGRGASKAGDRVQTSTLFHHLQREVSRKRGGVLPRCFAGAAGKPHRRRPSWRSLRQGAARSAQLVRVRGRARRHRRGDKAAMPAGGAIGARQLQGPAAAEVAAVADGVFGWQHALQGRQKVPA